jgi:hypothetical protein
MTNTAELENKLQNLLLEADKRGGAKKRSKKKMMMN